MDTNLIVGYAALLLAFLALLATVFNKKRSKALIIITAVLVITSVTFVLWRPLKTAIHEALIFPALPFRLNYNSVCTHCQSLRT